MSLFLHAPHTQNSLTLQIKGQLYKLVKRYIFEK